MNKLNFYKGAVIALLLVNLFLVYMMNKPKHRDEEGPRRIIIERLGFSSEQVEAYDKLISDHRGKMRDHDQAMRKLKNELYATLKDKEKKPLADSLIREIGREQMNAELIHYSHFNDIHALCKPEQEEKFSALTNDIAALFAPHKPGKKK